MKSLDVIVNRFSSAFPLSMFAVLVLSQGCAVPVPPTGGPADAIPPMFMTSTPANGSVEVAADRLTIEFDERIDARTAFPAFSITPAFSRPARIEVHGSKVEVIFPEPLRENTTYIASLDTRLRDVHNVALTSPVRIAFGTGPTINKGKLTGRVVKAGRGDPAMGTDIFLYAIDGDSLASVTRDNRLSSLTRLPPDYRTQTDSDGHFVFDFLSERRYFVLAVQDRNGNRRPDPGEPVALPGRLAVLADTVSVDPGPPSVLATLDHTSPFIRRVRALSPQLLALRFSEAVVLSDTSSVHWIVQDSTSGRSVRVRYTFAGADATEIRLRTTSLSFTSLLLSGYGAVSDSSGNRMTVDTLFFHPSASTPEPPAVFRSFLPDTSVVQADSSYLLWPGSFPGLLFDSAPDFDLSGRLTVVEPGGDSLRYRVQTTDGIRITLTDLENTEAFTVQYAGADTLYSRHYRRADSALLGEISGTVRPDSSGTAFYVELIRDDGRTGRLIERAGKMDDPDREGARQIENRMKSGTARFLFSELPGGARYRLRFWLDTDGDGKWSPGQIFPFERSEPIGWKNVEERVRARWETVVPDTLHLQGY